VSFSLNEVEALAKKATRGAGYSWGLAEEASKAVRFLCHHGLDGCGALADVLERFDGGGTKDCVPFCENGLWQGTKGDMCPIYLGSALSDRADHLPFASFHTSSVAQPILLVPFAATIARAITKVVTLTDGRARIVTDGRKLAITGECLAQSEGVVLDTGGRFAKPLDITSRAVVDGAIWARLNAFAHRTYAPATDESRAKGAG
jgi:hypothetical protein